MYYYKSTQREHANSCQAWHATPSHFLRTFYDVSIMVS
jgi:hypothetical protein